MSKEVNWLKFRLRGAKTAVEAARTNEQVSLFARQALEAAESGLAAALLQWDTPFLTNGEKSWREIIREISRKPAALWHYATALRGPDVNTPFSPTIKAAFTCPLRGRCAHALGKETFLELDIEGSRMPSLVLSSTEWSSVITCSTLSQCGRRSTLHLESCWQTPFSRALSSPRRLPSSM